MKVQSLFAICVLVAPLPMVFIGPAVLVPWAIGKLGLVADIKTGVGLLMMILLGYFYLYYLTHIGGRIISWAERNRE